MDVWSRGNKVPNTSWAFCWRVGRMVGLERAEVSSFLADRRGCPGCFEFEKAIVTLDSVAGGSWRSKMAQVRT